MSKKSKLNRAEETKPATVGSHVTVMAGLGLQTEVRTVSALVHLTILHARKVQAVAAIKRRVEAGKTFIRKATFRSELP